VARPQSGLQCHAALVARVTITPPGVDDVRTALAASRKVGMELWCWLLVAIASGARRDEVCALRWCDVDLDERFVRIERSVSATSSAGVVIKSTKTGKPRVVSLTTQAVDALAERRAHAARTAATADAISKSPNSSSRLTHWANDLGDPTQSQGVGLGSARRSVSATSGSTTFATSLPPSSLPLASTFARSRIGSGMPAPRRRSTSTGASCRRAIATPLTTSMPCSGSIRLGDDEQVCGH